MNNMINFMDEAFKAYHDGGVREVESLTLKNIDWFIEEMRTEVGFRRVVSKIQDYVQWGNKNSKGRYVGCAIAGVLQDHRLMPDFDRNVYSGLTTPKSIWARWQRIKTDGARAMERVEENIRRCGRVSWKKDTAKEIMLAGVCIPGVVSERMGKDAAYQAILSWLMEREKVCAV